MSNANIFRSATNLAGQFDPGEADGLISGAPGDPSLEGFAGQSFVYQAASQTLDDLLYSSTSISTAFDKQAGFDTLLWDVESTYPGGTGPQTPGSGTSPGSGDNPSPEGTGPQTPGGTGPSTPEGTNPQFPGGSGSTTTEGTGPQTPGGETGTGTPPPAGSPKDVVVPGTPAPATAPLTKAEILAAMAAALGVSDPVVASKPPAVSAALAFDTSAAAQTNDIIPGSLLGASPDPLGLF